MSQEDWKKLREWLYRVFPADIAAEEYAEHVKAARREGLELPENER